MTNDSKRTTWADFERYFEAYPDWYDVLIGKDLEIDGRHSRVDAVYYDHRKGVYKVRVRFEDRTSRTYEALEWSNLDKCLPFPQEARLRFAESIRGDHADVARALESAYVRSRDPWCIARACSEWRKAGSARDAVRSVDTYLSELSSGPRAAALTSRGAAMADFGRWEEAEKGAMEALNVGGRETHHPYMLLMRVHLNTGREELADDDLHHAQRLGLRPGSVGDSIRSYIREIRSPVIREQVIERLIQIDPNRYGRLLRGDAWRRRGD